MQYRPIKQYLQWYLNIVVKTVTLDNYMTERQKADGTKTNNNV